ncbi:MAG TPA: hypothetical protein VFW96_14175 [Thermomicrobiales bacterium]|nr:hypothetical protein [Thermomicrobiales bacterium]
MNDEPRDELAAANRLLLAAAEGRRRLDGDELRSVLEQVAPAGFHPTSLEQARGRLRGIAWRGRVLAGRDRLPAAEAHYLRHVVVGQEWPAGTTLTQYLASIRDVILDPASGVLIGRYSGEWQLTVVRRSGALRGSQGFEWVMVDYRVSIGHWVTAHQLAAGLSAVTASPLRERLQWLRPAT